jgi:hypothetical protein
MTHTTRRADPRIGQVIWSEASIPLRQHRWVTCPPGNASCARGCGQAARTTAAPEPGAGGTDGLTRAERRMLQALGREPTPEELAAELDLSRS